MIKKLKELNKKDKQKICRYYRGNKNCSENCILFKLRPNRPRLCSCSNFNKEEREFLEQEIDLEMYEMHIQDN